MSDLQQIFGLMRKASRDAPAPTLAQRRAKLDALKEMLLAHEDDIATAISDDFGGRSRHETQLLELIPVLNAIRHAHKNLARWMRDEARKVSLSFWPARAWVRHEPLGVVGIIAPWNYPLLLSFSPLCDALAAGNRALIKPSELTPAFSALLQQLIAQSFAPEDVQVITGGVDVAERFSALPFDHLIFTGSTAVGRKVMKAAAENLTPVTLELGGKSPGIVCPGYDLAKAATSVAFGKFVNAGQTCIAPDYVLVPRSQTEAFARQILAVVSQSYPQIQANHDYTNMISERHRRRLIDAVAEARAAGATVLTHADATRANGKISPTVVLDAPGNCLLMTEEIFGPVLPIVPYDTLDDALAFVRAREKPLALYCFSNSRAETELVLSGAPSGGVTVNGTLLHIAQDDLPFGGVGASGMGAYHGKDGFRRFSHARAVHHVGFVNVFEQIGPPWGRAAQWIGRILSRGPWRR